MRKFWADSRPPNLQARVASFSEFMRARITRSAKRLRFSRPATDPHRSLTQLEGESRRSGRTPVSCKSESSAAATARLYSTCEVVKRAKRWGVYSALFGFRRARRPYVWGEHVWAEDRYFVFMSKCTV